METIGVQAVVEGLSSFVGDMDKIQKSIENIIPPASVLQDAFGALGKAAGDFASWVADVLTYTLGNLLADAIESVVSFMGEMIQKTIEAGSAFQTLSLRLDGINLNDKMQEGLDYNAAMAEATRLTKEQLDWLQLLAMTTPYDNTDISNVYTMARTYGFADEQARALTEDTANLVAGMGLEKDSMVEVIRNLGQMAAKGKITGREMTDLANRQVPIADILQRIVDKMNETNTGFVDNSGSIAVYNDKLETLKDKLAIAIQKEKEFTDKTKESTRMANALTIENLRKQIDEVSNTIGGLTNQEKKLMTVADLMKQISKPGAGVDYKLFIEAFQEMTDEENRFTGAAERMARTFNAAVDNVKDLFTSFGGLNIVVPVLDVLGGKIADFMDNFSTKTETGRALTELGTRLRQAFLDVGTALADIVSKLLSMGPSTKDLASGLVTGLETFAGWLTENKDNIVGKVQEVVNGIKGIVGWVMKLAEPDVANACNVGLIPSLRDLADQLFKADPVTHITGWLLLKIAFQEVANALMGVLNSVLETLGMDTLPNIKLSVEDLVKALVSFANWIRENQELIKWLLIAIGAFIVIQTITNLVWTFIFGLVSLAATVAIVGIGFVAILAILLNLGAGFAIVKGIITGFILFWTNMGIAIAITIQTVVNLFWNMQNTLQNIFNNVESSIRNRDWWGVGWAIVNGIAQGLYNNAWIVIQAAQDAAWQAYQAAKRILGIQSPSVMFAGIGENLMLGMAQGITETARVAVAAMQGAIAAVSMPAMSAPSVMAQYSSAPSTISNTYQQSNQYNLQINSNANTEPVISDFNMLASLAG